MQIEKTLQNQTPDQKFSFVIPTWNNLAYLKIAVKSIRDHSFFQHQIIIHINEGTDGTLEWVKAQPDLDYVHSQNNIGICYALNICRSLMRTDYLAYMNDDMYLCPGWDRKMWAEIESLGHNDFFLSCTLIEPVDTKNPCVIVKDYGRSADDFDEAGLLQEFRQLEKRDWQGSTWPINIIHVDNWDLVGGLSPEFSPGMYSDPDFSKKLWDLGVRYFKGLGQCRAYHFVSKSTKRVPKNHGRKTFLLKWGMTANFFTRHFLKRGEAFDGPLSAPDISSSATIAARLKRLISAIK